MNNVLLRSKLFVSFLAICSLMFTSGNPKTFLVKKDHPFAPASLDAADSLMTTLTLEEKIAQSFVLAAPSSAEQDNPTPGGVLFRTMGDIENDGVKASSKGIDKFRVMALSALNGKSISYDLISAVNDPTRIRNYANAMGGYLDASGINVALGPSLDLFYSDETPYADHTFGGSPQDVAQVAFEIMEGLQANGILTVANNFPGLGNTTRGFESAPPTVYTKRKAFYSNDLVPFKTLVNQGLQSVAMGNAFVPGLDSTFNVMASTSPLIHLVLREELGFNGLVWSDVSNLKTGNSFEQNPAAQSYIAGSDVIIVRGDLDVHISAIKKQLELGVITRQDIDLKCKRILQSKIWLRRSSPDSSDIRRRKEILDLREREMYSDALTLLLNKDEALPLRHLDTTRMAVIKIGSQSSSTEALIKRYSPADVFHFDPTQLEADFQNFMSNNDDFNLLLIIADGEDGLDRKRFELSPQTESVIERLTNAYRSILIWNGKDKGLRHIQPSDKLIATLAGHESFDFSDDLSIQALFGGRPISGQLRKNIDDIWNTSTASTTERIRLGYGKPEEVGINSQDLEKIDELAQKGIDEMAYPGCQVWFAKDSMVVVNKAYGTHTYREEQAVSTSDLYDLASITKIAGSVAALMRLHDEGRFNLDYRLCDYLGDWVDTTDYMQLTMKEILAHQAGLTPWIPFYTKTLSKGVPRYDVYSLAQSETYPLQVARELFITKDYSDLMFREILNHKLSDEREYKYSDVGYYFALRIIERLTETSLDCYLDSTYYEPLGLTTMGYHPLDRFDKTQITPTEYDKHFRDQLVHGYVHDPGAAMLGGVGGHAGLFSNANDLGVLMQLYLNGGSYGGKTYFSPETIDAFTQCQFCDNDNRRGAGFDKPLTDGSAGPSCGCTSLDAFGHQGFTGTVTWADPEEDVVYVFLSNRVYPNANNKKLLELNIRTEIQKAFYQAVEKGKELASE